MLSKPLKAVKRNTHSSSMKLDTTERISQSSACMENRKQPWGSLKQCLVSMFIFRVSHSCSYLWGIFVLLNWNRRFRIEYSPQLLNVMCLSWTNSSWWRESVRCNFTRAQVSNDSDLPSAPFTDMWINCTLYIQLWNDHWLDLFGGLERKTLPIWKFSHSLITLVSSEMFTTAFLQLSTNKYSSCHDVIFLWGSTWQSSKNHIHYCSCTIQVIQRILAVL